MSANQNMSAKNGKCNTGKLLLSVISDNLKFESKIEMR